MTARQVSPLGVVRASSKPWPALFWVNVLLWTLFHILPVLYGIAVGLVFDALDAGDPSGVRQGLLLLGAAIVSRVGVFQVGVWRYSIFWHRWRLLLQRNLLGWLLTADGSRIPPSATGAAVSTFREDVDELVEYVENWIDSGGLITYVLGALGVLFAIDPVLTGVVLVPMVIAAVLNRLMSDRIRHRRTILREATESVTGYLGDLFRAIMPVKAAGVERRLLAHLVELNETRNDAALRDTAITEILRSVVQNMANIATGLVLIVGAASLRDGALSVGALATFVVYIPRLTSYLAWGGDIVAQHARTDVSLGRIRRLSVDAPDEALLDPAPLRLDEPLVPLDRPVRTAPFEHLSVRGLTYRHPSTGGGITDLDLDLPAGSFTVVTGRVGSGKTTLLRALLGLLPAETGEIRWNGALITDPASHFVPPRAAYTAQVPRLVSTSLVENLTLGRVSTGAQVDEAIRLAVMEEDVEDLEDGLDSLVGTRGIKLSGGQIQRAAAARMFLTESDLLVFDDLSSALDIHTETELWERLFEARDATSLVVSHRKPALRRADQIILLQDGMVADRGSLAELLERSEEMRALWDHESDA